MREKLDALDAADLIHWPSAGGFPRLKRYLSNVKGRAVGDLWTDINVINSQAAERTGFSTQKPEALLERVLAMATDPGEIVLDCFAGSGTTAAVATKMGRRWIGSELAPDTVETFIVKRLSRVVEGADIGGISAATGWGGGGGFRCLSVGPSMYEVLPNDTVLLAGWATNGRFARAVAAQLDFDFDAHGTPFCGRRGRMRLAVLDGAVGPEEVHALITALDKDDRVTVVAKVVLPGAEQTMASQSRGSRIRKAPRDLLADETRRSRRRASSPR